MEYRIATADDIDLMLQSRMETITSSVKIFRKQTGCIS